jgi:predicted dehydrogenase
MIVGCGSIGERHLRTFLRTGRCRVIACDTDEEKRTCMASRYKVPSTGNWQETLKTGEIYATVIATPADSHVPLAKESLQSGCHCLIEKPLALDLDGTDGLLFTQGQSGRAVAVAYVHRCRPAFIAAAAFLRSGRFGRILHVTAVSGQDFAALRPAYQLVYYRARSTGGGAIQDALTHMVNAVEWVLGPSESVFCTADHLAIPGVEVEDTVAAIAKNGSTIVSYSLNQFQAPNETTLQFNAENGSVKVEFASNRWATLSKGDSDWSWQNCPIPELDALFVAQAHAFLDRCNGKSSSLATLEEGIQAVAFNVAAFESLATRAAVAVRSKVS